MEQITYIIHPDEEQHIHLNEEELEYFYKLWEEDRL
jgi:hypothetical protein